MVSAFLPADWAEFTLGSANLLLAVVVIATAVVIASFSARSLEHDHRRRPYFVQVAVIAGGSAVLLTSSSLPFVWLGWVISGWALVALVGYEGHLPATRRAQRRIATTLAVGDVALLCALIIAANASNGVLVADAGSALSDLNATTLAGIASVDLVAVLLVLAGASRSALVPFHRWLIGTLMAPTPVSALVHAGLVSGAGLLLLRFAPVFVASDVAVIAAFVLGLVTLLIATTASVLRSDVKGGLAWSTVAQMAFMVIQISVGAFSSAIMHIVGHGMYKASLFLGTGDTISKGLVARRRPVPLEQISVANQRLLAALFATAAVALAVFVIPPDVSAAGRVLVVVFAWLSLVFALIGWLRRGPLVPRNAVLLAFPASLAMAFTYVGGLRLVEALVKPSLEGVAEATVIGPTTLVFVITVVMLFVGALAAPSDAARSLRARWCRFVIRVTEDRTQGDASGNVAVNLVPTTPSAPIRRAEIRADVSKAAAVIAPQWPLSSFVAVNPLGGLETQGFEEAASQARTWLGAKTHLSLDEYRDDHERGLTTVDDLRYVVHAEHLEVSAMPTVHVGGTVLDPVDVVVADLLHGPDAEAAETPELPVGGIDDVLSSWIRDFVDHPPLATANHAQSFARHARTQIIGDPRIARHLDETKRTWLASLADDPAAMLDAALSAKSVPDSDRIEAVRYHLCQLPGWAGLAKWRNEWAHADEERPPLSPLDIAATRAVLDALVAQPVRSRRLATEVSISDRVDAVAASLSGTLTDDERSMLEGILRKIPADSRASLWLRAQERNLDKRLLGLLDNAAAAPSVTASSDVDGALRSAAQMVFCIDVRSEGLRREIEARGAFETIGFAGFFGVPMSVQRLGWNHHEARCPVLVNPAISASEYPRNESIAEVAAELSEQRARAGFQSAHSAAKYGLGSSFALAETAGWFAGPLAAWKTFRPGHAALPADPPTKVLFDDDEVLVDQRIFFAESVLKTMGLVDGFAELVVLCGHSSVTTNNLHATALECGACAGASGDSNARAVAALLNSTEIRHGLSERGLDIPDDTWFVAAVHDTASDVVTMLDVPDVPDTHQTLLADLSTACRDAGQAQSERRAAHLSGSGRDVRDRGADWAQVRPEWGLASNAAFIIGPRSMTADLDLEGRAFLHTYDADADPTGRVLETIMTAPLVVGHWISSQYYFSTVDPEAFGAGNKLLHNPVGTTGVISGDRGDLRVGLPLQSTHIDGRRFHQPVRLLAIIQADLERIESTIAANPVLQSLTKGSWLRIAGRSHPGDEWSMRTPDGTWIAPPRIPKTPNASSTTLKPKMETV